MKQTENYKKKECEPLCCNNRFKRRPYFGPKNYHSISSESESLDYLVSLLVSMFFELSDEERKAYGQYHKASGHILPGFDKIAKRMKKMEEKGLE